MYGNSKVVGSARGWRVVVEHDAYEDDGEQVPACRTTSPVAGWLLEEDGPELEALVYNGGSSLVLARATGDVKAILPPGTDEPLTDKGTTIVDLPEAAQA